MINKLKPKSEFSRNVLTLMTGTTIAQAIPIAISPILTRIYTPEDFGVLSLFIAITAIFGSIASGRYELAIMLPKKDEDAINVFALGFIITCVISFIVLIIVILFSNYLTNLLGNEEIRIWLYFVPFGVFFTGLWNILNYFNNRKKQYKDLAKATMIKSIITAIIQLFIGFLKDGVSGLISGSIISQFFANTKLLKNILKDKILISKISKVKIIALAKRYKNFPKISLLSNFIHALNQHYSNILISTFYSIGSLGFYSLVQRVLGIPSSLIGSAISQVFLQEAIKEKQETGKSINSFMNTLKKLIFISLPIFIILFFTIEDLFLIIFGRYWIEAGTYAKILIPLFCIRLISSPLSTINTVFEKQIYGLYISLILLMSTISIITISYYINQSIIKLLEYLNIILSIEYLLFLLHYYLLSNGDYIKKYLERRKRQ